MISLRRTTLVFLILVAGAFGVGLGSWGAGAVDSAKSPRARPVAGLQAPLIPAALPIPSGSFAQVAETVGPAVININTVTRGGGGGRTPVEEFFGDEFFRRCSGCRAAAPTPPPRSVTRTASRSGTGCWPSARRSASARP